MVPSGGRSAAPSGCIRAERRGHRPVGDLSLGLFTYGWGNSIRQLVTALEAADWLDVPRVYIPPTWYLEGGDPIHFRGHEVIQSDGPSPEERHCWAGPRWMMACYVIIYSFSILFEAAGPAFKGPVHPCLRTWRDIPPDPAAVI